MGSRKREEHFIVQYYNYTSMAWTDLNTKYKTWEEAYKKAIDYLNEKGVGIGVRIIHVNESGNSFVVTSQVRPTV